MRRPPVPVDAIGSKERRQIERIDRVQDEPGEVILREPLAQARRQQQLLLAITRDEVLRHPDIVLTPPDGPHAATSSVHSDRARSRRPIDSAMKAGETQLRKPR